jgi:Protein of unknown function (DUF3052)
MAGYSATPLSKKLGFKSGFRAWVRGAPDAYESWLEPLPDDVTFLKRGGKDLDFLHLFVKQREQLADLLPDCIGRIKRDGMIWVSWPKKASKVATDVTEDVIRDVALPLGLVDVKVCAVDETWSGLKLVIRRENR